MHDGFDIVGELMKLYLEHTHNDVRQLLRLLMEQTTCGGRFMKKHIEAFYNNFIAWEKCDLLNSLKLLKSMIMIDMSHK